MREAAIKRCTVQHFLKTAVAVGNQEESTSTWTQEKIQQAKCIVAVWLRASCSLSVGYVGYSQEATFKVSKQVSRLLSISLLTTKQQVIQHTRQTIRQPVSKTTELLSVMQINFHHKISGIDKEIKLCYCCCC